MTLAYIGVGSNVDREKHIQVAFDELKQLSTQIRVSQVYQCPSFGFDSADFYNLVFEIEVELSLEALQAELKSIELRWGREKNAKKFQARTLDLDILLFGNHSVLIPVVPRDDIFKYDFVLKPLNELCPKLIIPNDGRTVEQLHSDFMLSENTIKSEQLTAIVFNWR